MAALDTTGNTIALNGSDTLHDVTTDVLAACPGATTNGISYQGGGSGVGEAQMAVNTQQVSPMSRSMKNSEYCTEPAVTTALTACAGFLDQASCVAATNCTWNGTACVGDPNLAAHLSANLLIGLDGVAIVANETNSCSSAVANGFGASAVGAGNSMSVTVDGTATGAPVSSCVGCSGSTYMFTDTFDALKILYLGIHHDSVTAPTYDCTSPVRKTLIRQWNNIFSTPCAAGNGTCSAGITHAWRRSDLSGTTDAFLSILAGGDLPNKGASKVGIGSPPAVTVGASKKMNPFCNTADANSTASPPPTTNGGSGDYADLDPVRTNCTTTGTQKEDVCEGSRNPAGTAKFAGDLGVVLPVLIPDTTVTQANEVFQTTQQCGGSCAAVAPIKSSQLGSLKCPNGAPPTGGVCFMPFFVNGANQDPRCFSVNTNKCTDTVGSPDGRMYNLAVIVPASDIPTAQRGTTPFQFAFDSNKNVINGAFYRIHSLHPGLHNVPGATNGLCVENDDTSQIGCLADSDPCSIGFAGREAAAIFPGGGNPSTAATTKGLSVNGVTPYTPSSINPDPDFAIKALFTGQSPLYPLSRRLYFATMYGFQNLKGGEAALTSCFATNSITNTAIANRHFIPVPATGDFGGGVKCLDFPEDSTLTASPAPNIQGEGNQALPGCNLGLTNVNACAGVTISP